MNKKQKTIGILGGMGPMASANLYYKIIAAAQDKYQAEQDLDFPPMIIYSMPLFGFNETGFVDPDLVKNQLIEGVKKLEKAGSDFIIIACNTVHYFYDQMQKSINIPILSVIDETVNFAKKEGFKKVGILSSESTWKLQIYQNKLAKSGIEALSVLEKQQKILNEAILNIMAGVHGKKDTRAINMIIESFIKQGAESVILGCTEIPMAIHQDDTEIPLLDSIQIIAEAALRY